VSTMTKVFVVLTSILAVVLSSLTVATAARWSNAQEVVEKYKEAYHAEQVHRVNLQARMATELAMKQDALQQASEELAEQRREVADLDSRLQGVQIELARETADRAQAEAGRKKLEEILDVQTVELTSAQKQQQALLTQNIDLQTRNQRLASRVLELTSQTTIQNDELRNLREKLYAAEQRSAELEQSLAAGAPRMTPTAAPTGVAPVDAPVQGPIRGEVVEVDGRYVSLSVGESSGVVAGMKFMVYRGNKYVGDLEVESVRPKESGGKLVMVAPGEAVQRGDRVAWGLE
jgi:hypothetical protein